MRTSLGLSAEFYQEVRGSLARKSILLCVCPDVISASQK